MSVLDNIMVGRHHLLKNNFITGSLYWLTGARARNSNIAARSKRSSTSRFWQSVRKATAGTLPYGLRKRVELARCDGAGAGTDTARRADGRLNFEEKEDMARLHRRSHEEFGMTVMMIEHDMGVVWISHTASWCWISAGRCRGRSGRGAGDPHVKRAYLGAQRTKCWSIRRQARRSGVRGMMD